MGFALKSEVVKNLCNFYSKDKILVLIPRLDGFYELIFPGHLMQMFIFISKQAYGCNFICL